jgi:hypothetical protein
LFVLSLLYHSGFLVTSTTIAWSFVLLLNCPRIFQSLPLFISNPISGLIPVASASRSAAAILSTASYFLLLGLPIRALSLSSPGWLLGSHFSCCPADLSQLPVHICSPICSLASPLLRVLTTHQ